MAINRIDQVRSNVGIPLSQAPDGQRTRLDLHSTSTYERVDSVTFGDGSRIDLPQLGSEDRQLVARFLSAVPAEKRAEVDAACQKLAQAVYAEARATQGIQTGSISGGLTQSFNQTLEVYMVGSGHVQREDAVTGVMISAMANMENELQDFARYVSDRQGMMADTRTQVTELREMVAEWPDDGSTQSFTWTEVTTDENGNTKVVERQENLTKDEASKLLDKLDAQLQNLRDMTELDRFDLQKKYEQYQQGFGILSAILKQQHDTQKAIISNVKAS